MNQLSWLIYFADISSTLGGWLTAFAIIGFLMCAAMTIVIINGAGDKLPKGSVLIYPLFLLLLVGSIMIPSRQTVLAIAASEMGEKVLATPQAKRVGEALMNWIDDQTKPPPAPREEDRR